MANSSANTVSIESVREALRQVIDPEVGVNIVDLGLVYDIELASEQVTVIMTMTSPACPMGPYIQDEVETVLRELAGGETRVNVEVVWEPAWSPEKMSEQARQHFGLG